MILDNENDEFKVHEWIREYTSMGSMSLVTGYFTVGGLAYFADVTQNVTKYRILVGDIVSTEDAKKRGLDLLNEDISVSSAFELRGNARDAVSFLEKDIVQLKTLEPNFCHAKVCLFDGTAHLADKRNREKQYFLFGSSNLTEAGMGLKKTNNVELNIAGQGSDPQFDDLKRWFENLWDREQAHKTKTVIDSAGYSHKIPFKEYLIGEIKKIYREYTPREIYYKVLFELFGEELLNINNDPNFIRRIGRLENTEVYNALYDFQKKGTISLIKMLEKYNGAILADAVGLGKTWSALAVMKYYQMQGREVILVCPKKLQHNWQSYQKNHDSRFEKDGFEFFMRYHTDMTSDLMERKTDRSDKYFRSDKPKLFVIDESHNLRNDKSQRYDFLLKEVLAHNEDVKVLMLSATPINNTLLDIRNQFKLIVKGQDDGFDDSLGIRSLESMFRRAQQAFNEWAIGEAPRISEFVRNLPKNFFNLTDALIVARTRAMIEGHQDGLEFPRKAKPENLFVTPRKIGEFDTFEELFNAFPPLLSGYAAAQYVEQEANVDVLRDERQRAFFLIKMMYILLVKRLESSWFSFDSTVTKVLLHHENALVRIANYEQAKIDAEEAEVLDVLEVDEDLESELDSFTLGKKSQIKLSDIDASGLLDYYKDDLRKDVESLQRLQKNLRNFGQQVARESGFESADIKLQTLIERIQQKRRDGANGGNPKVLIFTVYKDTAFYLFDQLTKRGFKNVAAISGDASRVWNEKQETKIYEPILERFAPFTKLFREKEWPEFKPSPDLTPVQQFEEWQQWIAENDRTTARKLENNIDILIATDALSEGQNLQDCDMVINYDIHWNPVRVIQRMGRIDRLGSPNTEIFGINFWPSDNINSYLNLQGRIEQRMAVMKLAGSEVHHEFSDTFAQMAKDENLERRQKEKMLNQMQDTWDDINGDSPNLGFDDLSLESFRQQLLEELSQDEEFYRQMPRGVYTGYKTLPQVCPTGGVAALLGFPRKPPGSEDFTYKDFELIYIDKDGNAVLGNRREVLDVLAQHKAENRFTPSGLDDGQPEAINVFSGALHQWLDKQAVTEEIQPDGSVKKTMGDKSIDQLSLLKLGGKKAVEAIKAGPVADKYKEKDFDLIAWFAVS